MAAAKRNPTRTREKPQQIADQLRLLIVSGKLSEGDSLGHEPDLVQRFGVSRPSLREALRILEAEGLVTVVRGVRGGVVVHEPDARTTARAAALLLQARSVSLADVFAARGMLEPIAAREIAARRNRRTAIRELRALIDEEEVVIADSEKFGTADAAFHRQLVALAGNQTLGIVAETLHEIVARAVGRTDDVVGSLAARRRRVGSQERLLELLEEGDGTAAEEHWRSHMQAVGRVMLGRAASAAVEILDHY